MCETDNGYDNLAGALHGFCQIGRRHGDFGGASALEAIEVELHAFQFNAAVNVCKCFGSEIFLIPNPDFSPGQRHIGG